MRRPSDTPSTAANAASKSCSAGMPGNSLFLKILLVNSLNPRFYGNDHKSQSSNRNKINTLPISSRIDRNAQPTDNPLFPNILPIRSLDSIFREEFAPLVSRNPNKTSNLANRGRKSGFLASLEMTTECGLLGSVSAFRARPGLRRSSRGVCSWR